MTEVPNNILDRLETSDPTTSSAAATAMKNITSVEHLLASINDQLETKLRTDARLRHETDKKQQMMSEWMIAAAVIDRFCFIIFSLCFVVGTSVIFISATFVQHWQCSSVTSVHVPTAARKHSESATSARPPPSSVLPKVIFHGIITIVTNICWSARFDDDTSNPGRSERLHLQLSLCSEMLNNWKLESHEKSDLWFLNRVRTNQPTNSHDNSIPPGGDTSTSLS